MHQKKFKPLNFEKHPQKAISHLSVHWVGSWRMGDWQSHCYRLKVSQLYQFTSKQRSQYCQSKTLSNLFFPAWHHKSSWKLWILLIPPIYSCFKTTVFSTCNHTTHNNIHSDALLPKLHGIGTLKPGFHMIPRIVTITTMVAAILMINNFQMITAIASISKLWILLQLQQSLSIRFPYNRNDHNDHLHCRAAILAIIGKPGLNTVSIIDTVLPVVNGCQ